MKFNIRGSSLEKGPEILSVSGTDSVAVVSSDMRACASGQTDISVLASGICL